MLSLCLRQRACPQPIGQLMVLAFPRESQLGERLRALKILMLDQKSIQR